MDLLKLRSVLQIACAASLSLLVQVYSGLSQEPPAPPAPQPPQTQSAPASSQATAVLRSTTRLVQLNVIVEDRKGQPALNLKREDFELLDDGKPQELAIFSPAVALPVHVHAAPPPPNVFDNRAAVQNAKSGSVSVILIDALNTTFEDQVFVKSQVLKLLRKREPKEFLAIYLLKDRLYVLQDFTQDSKALLEAVHRLQPNSLAPLDASTPRNSDLAQRAGGNPSLRTLDQRIDRANAEVASVAISARVNRTIAGFSAIADHLAYIAGRKSLIWLSSSFPISFGYGTAGLTPVNIDSQSFSVELQSAARALNRVSMSVYPVYAGGVEVRLGGGAGLAPAASLGDGFFTGASTRDTMNSLAQQTGGRAFYGTNDLAGAMAKAIDETELSYSLGFYPDHNRWDGSYHHLKLRCKNPALRLRLRYRDGYFATNDLPDPRKEMETDLVQATKNPVDSTSIGLRVIVKTLEASVPHTLRVYLHLDAGEIFLEKRDDGVRTGGLDLLFYQTGAAGQVLAAWRQRADLHLKPDEYDSLRKSGIMLGSRQKIDPNAATMRIFVRDSSGAFGSVTIPVKDLQTPPAH